MGMYSKRSIATVMPFLRTRRVGSGSLCERTRDEVKKTRVRFTLRLGFVLNGILYILTWDAVFAATEKMFIRIWTICSDLKIFGEIYQQKTFPTKFQLLSCCRGGCKWCSIIPRNQVSDYDQVVLMRSLIIIRIGASFRFANSLSFWENRAPVIRCYNINNNHYNQ